MKCSKSLARGMSRLRRDMGMSQADLAEAAELSVQFVAALEQEERSATLKTVDKLCDALGVTASELFAAGEAPKKTSVAADKIGKLLQGMKAKDQERVVAIVREVRKLTTGRRRSTERR